MIAGGKKLPELDALTMAYNAIQQGAAGVDMGRNIFQSDAPVAMITAVHAVVHKNLKPADALGDVQGAQGEGIGKLPGGAGHAAKAWSAYGCSGPRTLLTS